MFVSLNDIDMKTNSNRLLRAIGVLLNIIWYANILLIVVAFSFLTVSFIKNNTALVGIRIDALQNSEIKMDSLADAHSATLTHVQDSVNIQLKNTFGYIAFAYFFLIATEALVMIIIYQLSKFFKSIEQQTPFNQSNIRRLKITALCSALTTVLHVLWGFANKLVIENSIKDSHEIHIVWEDSLIGLALGAVLYVMADVFAYGLNLKQENEEFV